MDAMAEVLVVERQWTEAHRQGETATIERLMAEDYIKIQSNGSVAGKAEVLASYESGRRAWEYAQGDEYDVRLYGETAVVIGRWTARGVNNGQCFDYAARFLSVIVAEQSTDIS